MGPLSRRVAVAILAGALGCDPGGPVPDAAVPADAAADGPSDAGSLDAAGGLDGSPGVDAGGDSGDAALATDASPGEDGGGLPVECEQADDFAIPADPEGLVTGAGTAARTGGFVVAWTMVDGIESFIRARLLDDCGVPEGGEIAVDVSGLVVGTPVVTAVGGTDDFAIAWSREDGDGDGAGVVFQRFGSDGSASGDEAVANDVTFDDQIASSAVALPSGFALAWTDFSAGVLVRPDAVMASFDETGEPTSGEFAVSPVQDGSQELPLLAALGDGGLLAAWTDGGWTPLARRRDAVGGWTDAAALQIAELDAHAVATGAAADGSSLAVGLTRFDADDAGDAEIALVTADGDVVSLISIAAVAGVAERGVQVAGLPGGGWLVAWTDDSERGAPLAEDASGTTVRGAKVDSEGTPLGASFVIPTTIDFDQELAAAAAGEGGTLLVWTDASRAGGDRDGGLRARLVPDELGR
ncbi:MAG: hypothetical protein HYY06_09730 [Deltaproteobacteria bacterium]|nr:hypothetical protein [Deltaproteobacteria bacterium]